MILSLSEYVALRVGIAVRPEQEQLWWSAVAGSDGAAGCDSSNYSQVIGETRFTLRITCGSAQLAQVAVGEIDGHTRFWFNGSARIVTDVAGSVTAVVGAAAQPQDVCVGTGARPQAGRETCLMVRPNEEFGSLASDCGTVALSKQQCRAMLWAEEVKCRFTFEARRIVLRPRKRRTPA